MRLVVSGGGTGGHFFPALEVLRRATDGGVDTLFVGSERGIEKKLKDSIPGEKLFLRSYPFRGVSLKDRIRASLSLLGGCVSLWGKLKKPFRSLVFGGYTSAPVGLVTVFKGAGLYIHEQNSIPSMTNRMLFPMAEKVFITFEYTRRFFRGKKVIRTGLPVRGSLLGSRLCRERAKELLGFDPSAKLVLFMGGSQGARTLNTLGVELARRIGIQVLILSGERDYRRTSELAKGLGNVKVFPFREDMALLYSACDMAVCRAGASTITELSLYGVPSLLIPYPYATEDHQYYNAKEIEELGGAVVLKEEDVSPSVIVSAVERVLSEAESMGEAVRSFANPRAVDLILEEILEK